MVDKPKPKPKPKPKLRKIHIDVYGFDLFYLVSSEDDCKKIFKESFHSDLSNKNLVSGWATSLMSDNGQAAYFIWMNEDVGWDNTVHEVFHAVKYILIDYAGLILSDHSDEAFAYLLAYLFKQVIDKAGEVCHGEQSHK